jgi:hypothetical protein
MKEDESGEDQYIITTPSMRFEARELEPDSQPVKAEMLREEGIYFSVTYADEEMLIPVMETLVFIGKNLDTSDVGLLYFQDVGSHGNGVRYGDEVEGESFGEFYTRSEGQLEDIFEYEPAVEELMRCSVRRRHWRTGS